MMHIFSRNRKNNLRTLLSLFKGHYGALVGSIFFFIIKHSPTWVLPIVTANIINAVTDHNGNITKILILNTILMIAFLVQNIPTNYIHTWLYAKTVRTVEKELREALVCKLQQLSITYHKEMQSGRLQSKIMRDVEQIQNLASQIFISLLTIILNIGVSFGVVIFKSRIVFLFFLCTIPVSVLIIVGFKGKIKTHNRAFRKEMEETSAKVMEMVEMIPVTKAHALEDQEARKMSEQLRKVAEKGLQLDMIQTYFSSISWVAFQIFQVFCLAFTAYIAWRGIIGVGDITLYQTYFSSIVAQIASIVTLLPIIAKGLESVESIGDVLCANDIEDNCRKKKVVDIAVKKDEEFPDLPRFGVRMFLDKKLTDAGFFGMGPQESYRDKHRAASHGLYRLKVSDMHEDYIRPQENGSHYDCDYVELGNSQYGITAVAEEDTFSFNASFYTQEELEEKAHNYELIESDSTVFCLDYAQNGIGSNSCGPDVLEAYRFDDRLFRFRFTLVPYVKG